jgi:hypothetical protein
MTIRQTGFMKDVVGTYIIKDPDAQLQYGIDWSQWLQLGDALQSATWTVETTGTNAIVAQNNNILDGVSLTTLVHGNPGTIYTVANTVTTQQGYVDTRRFRVKVEDRFIQ